MRYITLSAPIATIDIETLSLHPNAVVDEIGILITDVLPLTDEPLDREQQAKFKEDIEDSRDDDTDSPPNVLLDSVFYSLDLKLDVTEQVLGGRRVDEDTMRFRQEVHAKNTKITGSTASSLYAEYMRSGGRTRTEPGKEVLTSFFMGKKVTEVWMQHPQFDSPRVCGLLGNGFNVEAWHYRAERDVATEKARVRKLAAVMKMKDPFHIASPSPRVAHCALDDCFYNLWVIAKCEEFYQWLAKEARSSSASRSDIETM